MKMWLKNVLMLQANNFFKMCDKISHFHYGRVIQKYIYELSSANKFTSSIYYTNFDITQINTYALQLSLRSPLIIMNIYNTYLLNSSSFWLTIAYGVFL